MGFFLANGRVWVPVKPGFRIAGLMTPWISGICLNSLAELRGLNALHHYFLVYRGEGVTNCLVSCREGLVVVAVVVR